jgi:hypothetical protein
MPAGAVEQEGDVRIHNFDGVPAVMDIAAIEDICSVYVQLKRAANLLPLLPPRSSPLKALKNPDSSDDVDDFMEFEIARDATPGEIWDDLIWLRNRYGIEFVSIDEWCGE